MFEIDQPLVRLGNVAHQRHRADHHQHGDRDLKRPTSRLGPGKAGQHRGQAEPDRQAGYAPVHCESRPRHRDNVSKPRRQKPTPTAPEPTRPAFYRGAALAQSLHDEARQREYATEMIVADRIGHHLAGVNRGQPTQERQQPKRGKALGPVLMHEFVRRRILAAVTERSINRNTAATSTLYVAKAAHAARLPIATLAGPARAKRPQRRRSWDSRS